MWLIPAHKRLFLTRVSAGVKGVGCVNAWLRDSLVSRVPARRNEGTGGCEGTVIL